MMSSNDIKRCLICGCTEHKLLGCFTHWRVHNKNEGRCKVKTNE